MARLLSVPIVLLALASAAEAQITLPPMVEPPPLRPSAPSGPATPPATPTSRSAAEAAAKPKVLPRGAVMEEVSGAVRSIDRKDHRLLLDTASGDVTLSLDRNTMVYTPVGLGTVLDIVPGAQIRAGRNADFLAYWVQVRATGTKAAPPTPGQGTGPAGGAGPPPAEAPGTGGAVSPPSGPAPVGPAPAPPPAKTPGSGG